MICCVIEETLSPLDGGPAACPFVAFEDDRDHRSSAPDYRHRCFAAAEPEPRAFPHQERYCLASAFPQCPVFLDWARQEAAGVRQSGVASANGTTAGADDGVVAAAAAIGGEEAAPAFLAGRPRPSPGAAVAASTRRPTDAGTSLWNYEDEKKHSSSPSAPTAPSSLGSPAVAMARRGPSHPGWENPPRVENFPRLRSRDERRTNQPLLYAAVAVAALMVALIALPILLGNGGKAGPGPSHSPSASAPHGSASASAPAGSPSASTEPGTSYLQYTVKPNDSLSVIAQRFNLQLWEIELANPQITDPNHLEVSQVLNIPPAGLLTHPPASPSGH
jgi:LysM repeat protein